jgi:hypothetical protein
VFDHRGSLVVETAPSVSYEGQCREKAGQPLN